MPAGSLYWYIIFVFPITKKDPDGTGSETNVTVPESSRATGAIYSTIAPVKPGSTVTTMSFGQFSITGGIESDKRKKRIKYLFRILLLLLNFLKVKLGH